MASVAGAGAPDARPAAEAGLPSRQPCLRTARRPGSLFSLRRGGGIPLQSPAPPRPAPTHPRRGPVPRPVRRRAWVQLVGEEATRHMHIACIGSTSARAALKLGLPEARIKFPAEPGVATWAAVVEECLAEAGAA